jgi:di/tricarboxylate transporter
MTNHHDSLSRTVTNAAPQAPHLVIRQATTITGSASTFAQAGRRTRERRQRLQAKRDSAWGQRLLNLIPFLVLIIFGSVFIITAIIFLLQRQGPNLPGPDLHFGLPP